MKTNLADRRPTVTLYIGSVPEYQEYAKGIAEWCNDNNVDIISHTNRSLHFAPDHKLIYSDGSICSIRGVHVDKAIITTPLKQSAWEALNACLIRY